jgi:hypothetical protein
MNDDGRNEIITLRLENAHTSLIEVVNSILYKLKTGC